MHGSRIQTHQSADRDFRLALLVQQPVAEGGDGEVAEEDAAVDLPVTGRLN